MLHLRELNFPVVLSPPSHRLKWVNVRKDENPYKLVAIDMDGTLLNEKHSVSDYTRRVLSQLLARGVHVVFATGRPFTDVYHIKRKLNIFASMQSIATPGVQVLTPSVCSPDIEITSPNLDLDNHTPMDYLVPRCFAITSNGACIYDETNHLVRECCIHPQICHELYSMFIDDPEVNINVFRRRDNSKDFGKSSSSLSDSTGEESSEEWVSRYPSDLEAAIYHESNFTFRVVPNLERDFPTDNVNEIFFLCYNTEKTSPVEETIIARMKRIQEELHLEDTVRVAPSAQHCLDIVPANVSKASALEFVVEQLGITMENCIAFGDGLNDVELLQSVGKAYIMENANPRLKKMLPYLEVIGGNNDDAVAKKLSEIFELN
ncbi:unnamed protein product [Phytomonas sp. Hart1]|nr:unnamed protein product [Phytomonas sp. Hart1]|eukprot:CCW68682.1 unnamed protein product [Phytomonas sp. isolate Hart1]